MDIKAMVERVNKQLGVAEVSPEKAPVPKVGDGMTVTSYTDRTPYTVIAVSESGGTVTLQEDAAKLLNGVKSGEPDALEFTPGGFVGHTSGQQRYEYQENLEGKTVKVALRKNGEYKVVGTGMTERGGLAYPGRGKFYDYNF